MASISTTVFATRMVTRHAKRIEDSASPSYMNHAARRKDHLYRREDAPQARRQRRCLPAAEAAGSLLVVFIFFIYNMNSSQKQKDEGRTPLIKTPSEVHGTERNPGVFLS